MVDERRKSEILAAAESEGVTAAARRFRVPLNTLKSWRRRAVRRVESSVSPAPVQEGSVVGASDVAVEELLRRAAALSDVSEEARKAVQRAIRDGKSTGVKDLSIAVGVLIDQSGKLQAASERLREGEVRLEGERSQLMVAVIEVFMGALGLPFGMGSPSRRVLGAILRNAESAQGMSAPEPAAAEAREEIRRSMGFRSNRALPVVAGEVVDDPSADNDSEEVEEADVVVESADGTPVGVVPGAGVEHEPRGLGCSFS